MRYLIFLCLIWLSSTNPDGALPDKSRGETLFSLLDAKKTNISFNNKLEDTKEHNIMIYSNYYGGAGVGIGDINNDGLPDIFFAGNLVADKLYLNKGNMEFEDITKKAGILDNGGWSSGVLFGDVNQDGWLDIYVTRELYDDKPELRANKLYINQGLSSLGEGKEGVTFSEQAEALGVADTARTRHATFIDYDKDGDLDLFLLNQPPNPGDYSKFYGTDLSLDEYRPKLFQNESGSFTDVTEKAGLQKTGFPNSVSAADINGDGWTDLYVTNDFQARDWLYLNNGDGTFTDQLIEKTRHISYFSMGVDAGDINNDGQLDLMVLDMVAEDNYRLKTNMSGMNPRAFWKVVNDGGHYQYMFNTLQLNVGEGHLSDVAQLGNVATTDWSWSTLMADLDNDGWKDLFITNGLMRDIRNNDAAKELKYYLESALHEFIQKNPNPGDISIWDVVNFKNAMEIVPSQKLQNYVFKNEGDLRFSKKMDDWGFTQETFSNGAAYADLDQDGDLDLVVNNINDAASIYENHAAGQKGRNFLRIQAIADAKTMTNLGTKIWVKTVAGEQFHEISGVRGMYSSSETTAHFGLGGEEIVEEVSVRWPDGKENVLRQVSANQMLSVKYSEALPSKPVKQKIKAQLFSNLSSESILPYKHQENEFDDYKTQVLLPHKMSTFGPCMAKADINGDGLEDLFIGGAATHPGQIFLQKSDGTFEGSTGEALRSDKIREDIGAAFFDFDQDGDQDLYVVSGGNEFMADSKSYQDRLYINDGSGIFTKGEDLLPKMHISGSKVYPADFDQDGDLDLFVGGRHNTWSYPEPVSSALLRNEEGKFVNVTADLAPDLIDIGMVNDASWFDHNQDGYPDLVLVGEWMPITILQNNGTGFSKIAPNAGLVQSEGWWFSVETADMDQDGDLDIIAGNLGLNYKYKASPEEPFEVYYYDFDNNKSKDVVLTYYNFGIKYPLRGRQCSSEQVPLLTEKFPTYNLFAESDVSEIYGENALENALHYEAYTFASAYFENQGNGAFKRQDLPVMAQLSSVNDLITEDFNGDAHLDILLAGNLYSSEVETTRNDAGFGLLLTGDGKGNFTTHNQRESGFFVPYNVKSLIRLQSGQKQLILAGCNNDWLQVFRINKGQSE